MSIRNTGHGLNNNVELKLKKLSGNRPAPTTWVRNPSWLTLPSVGTSDQKLVGIFAVFPDTAGGEPSNFLSLSAAGNYTVDWGDGVVEDYNTGVQSYHVYDFNDADLANSNGPVTLIDSGDLVQRTAHGYTNGMEVRFYNIVSTTGLTEGQVYYVINANPNDFQISDTVGGSVVALTTDGSATLLPYKQALVTITPQAGQNLTNINLHRKHNQTSLQAYSSNWIDIRLGSPNLSSLGMGSSIPVIGYGMLEQVELVNTGSINSFYRLFYNLSSLKNVIIGTTGNIINTSEMFFNCSYLTTVSLFNTASVTNMSSMFTACRYLVTVPPFNTANVTNMSNMFRNCYSLTNVPLFNTASVTIMDEMFENCYSLTTVPLFNTANVTNMHEMFFNCYSLVFVPLFNTASVTTMEEMFEGCISLTTVPLFNTANVTRMDEMFIFCYCLTSVPLFNTANVTRMDEMFNYCYSLTSIPLFNTANVTNMNGMFNFCYSLTSVPLFNTANVTSMGSMFSNCSSLTTVPLFNTANVMSMNAMFNLCYSLSTIPSMNFSSLNSISSLTSIFASCGSISDINAYGARFTHNIGFLKLSRAVLKKYMDNLGVGTSQTLTISSNWGVGSNSTKTVTSTAQSVTVACTDTSGLSTGMMMTGTGTGINGVSVASDVSADTLTLNSHGLPNGTRVSFSALSTTTGVSINTIYYVVNSNTNDFQISLTEGGGAIDLTGTNATMTLRYPSYITAIDPNVSVTLDVPAASSQASVSWIFRTVDSYGALLRGWAVTY